MSIRVRYPPSPTGLQHIGGARTALFNYLFARSQGGTFILRIEDTDRTRYDEKAVVDLYETLEWLGIEWDEGPDGRGEHGPYVQSERAELYRAHADQLLESGYAYRCFCTPERLEEMRKQQKKSTGYDRRCRNLSAEEVEKHLAAGEAHVIRLKVPLEGASEFEDLILGRVKRKFKDVNPDPVLLKTDGLPTYHLANVVDDHFMEISHIMRAQEWLPSVPIHLVLYEAFGWTPPSMCHLPLVLGKDGQKLSKRHGSTSVRDFRDQGYLPEAMINFLALLGWSYDDQREFFTLEELEKLFSLEKLNKAPAVFDYKKLDWFNGQYIRQQSDADLRTSILPYLQRANLVSDSPTKDEEAIIEGMLPLVRERLKTLSDVSEVVRFLFEEVSIDDVETLVPKKLDAAKTVEILEAGRALLAGFGEMTDDDAEEAFRAKAEALEVKLGALLMPIRVAVTGSTASPPLFGSIRLLGLDTALERVDRAIAQLKEHTRG